MDFRGFVGAVLVPHGRKDAELGKCRRPPDQRFGALVFLRLEAVGSNERGRDAWLFVGHGFAGPFYARRPRTGKPLIHTNCQATDSAPLGTLARFLRRARRRWRVTRASPCAGVREKSGEQLTDLALAA